MTEPISDETVTQVEDDDPESLVGAVLPALEDDDGDVWWES